MEATYRNCQSCGMPMSRDEKGGGTNADGSKSAMYCSHCYAGGKFTLPGPLGWFFTRKVANLARWTS